MIEARKGAFLVAESFLVYEGGEGEKEGAGRQRERRQAQAGAGE